MSSTVRKCGNLTTQLACATFSGTRRGGASQREETSIEERARSLVKHRHGDHPKGQYTRQWKAPTPWVRDMVSLMFRK